MALKDDADSNMTDARKIAQELHVNEGRASAHQLERVLVDNEGANHRQSARVGGVVSQYKVCQVSEKASHLPFAGTSSVSSLSGGIQVGLPSLGDVISPSVMDVYS